MEMKAPLCIQGVLIRAEERKKGKLGVDLTKGAAAVLPVVPCFVVSLP